jgi:glc operon protein GlcG
MGDWTKVTLKWLATVTVTFGLIGAAAYADERPASLTFSGPVPPQYAVGPDEGSRFGVHDHITLRADLAERLSHICEANAKAHGGSATIVILDPYGQIIHEHRMDGQSYINQKAAENKARTSLLTREPSHVLTNRAFDDVSTLIRMDQFGLTVQEGGLPIIVNDQIIGAIGVGGGAGGASYGEERCAHDALTAAGGACARRARQDRRLRPEHFDSTPAHASADCTR